jgi:hypothetical protein
VFCERLVVSQRTRNVARQEAKAAVGVSFCGSSIFCVAHRCYSSYGLVFLRILFFLLQNIKSPASGLITLPFIFQGDSHSLCTLPPKKEEVTFFQIKLSKGRETRLDLGHWL